MLAIKLRVHRFRDTVAFHVNGLDQRGDDVGTETIYLTPHKARIMAAALQAYADDVDAKQFTASNIGTFEG